MSDNSNDSNDSNNSQERGDKKERSAAEWVTVVVSTLIMLALVGLVIFQYATQGTRPSTIKVEPAMEEVSRRGDAYYLPVNITNDGDRAVEDVEIQLSLKVGEGEPESAAFSVHFLAGGETDQEIVVFSNDPAKGQLSQVVSFHVP